MPIAADIEKTVTVPEGVNITIAAKKITIKGKKGELSREFPHQKIIMSQKDGTVLVQCKLPRMKDKALVGTVESHINNMIKGVVDGYEYTLKLVYSHFPVKMSVKGKEFIIENFLGEKCPRKARLMGDVDVKVKGESVVITGINKEHVGQSAANIELATRIKGYDTRVFQDGIYIVEKR